MINYLAVCIMIIGLSVQGCDKGCLKCNAKNECIFCDVANNYYLSGTSCAISTNTYCALLNLNGECQQCSVNYYLDSATRNCVMVNPSFAVENCLFYGLGITCVRCAKNFVMVNGKCVAVATKIDNCDTYAQDGKCSQCATGYTFNAARNSCVSQLSTTVCAANSILDCKSCASGYILNPNMYFAKYQSDAKAFYSDLRNFVLSGTLNSDWTVLARCQKIQDPNCLTASAYNLCTKCKPGYFLSASKSCNPNPKPAIMGCQIYSSPTTCSACYQGFYLENLVKCTFISDDKKIPDCVSFNTTAIAIQCTRCTDEKYLVNGACKSKRVNSLNMTNCSLTTANEDTCTRCNIDSMLTTDKKKCLLMVPNCKIHNPATSLSNTLTCKSCNETYYLNIDNKITTCIPGTIEGCLVYGSSSVCLACNTTAYYLYNSICSKHVEVPNCRVYSGINYNQCSICKSGFYPFSISATCSPIAVIPNCAMYSDESTCSSCNPGYFLKANSCLSISLTFPDCEFAYDQATSCFKCRAGYAMKNINNQISCLPNHNYILDQCEVPGSAVSFKANDAIDANSCVTCKQSSIAFSLSGLNVCISNNLLDTRGISSPVTDCKQYSKTAIPVCHQCPAYLGINSVNGSRSCIANCDTSSNTIVNDSLDGNINTCASNSAGGSYSVTGCSSAIKVYDGFLQLKCMKYSANKIYVALTSAASNNPSYWRDIDDSTVPRPDGAFLYFGYSVTNSLVSDTDAHQNEGDTNKSCELYWRTGTTLYCYRCKWGYASKHYIPVGETVLKTRCVLIDGCDTTISYTGFSAQLNQVLSCHACTNSRFVTVIVGTGTDNTTFNVNGLVRNKQTIQCLSVETNPSIASTESKPQSVDGCLIYGWIFLNTNPAAPTAPVSAKGCLACKPGFKLNNNFGTCTAIANCDTTKNLMANRCSYCSQKNSGGATEVKAFKTYLADDCVLVKSENCLFSETDPDSNNKYNCAVCRPGFWLNYDKVCEKITLPQCSEALGSTNVFPLPDITSSVNIGIYYILKYLAKANSISGCDTCNSGFTAVRINTGEYQCVSSSYVQSNSFVSSMGRYISNCAIYNNVLNMGSYPFTTCKFCKNGMILTDNGSKCVDPITNCLTALNSDPSKCYLCASNYLTISGACYLKEISNCVSYDTSRGTKEISCLACADEYVLATTRKLCYRGSVLGCKTYDMGLPWVCNTCLDGFSKISIANSKTYCLKINDGNNCKVFSVSPVNGLQAGYYKCNVCATNNTAAFVPKQYPLSDLTLPQTFCLPINRINNCASYDTEQPKLQDNTFLCNLCIQGFYYEEKINMCMPRKIQLPECIDYYPNKDKCRTCSPNSIKNADETDCIVFPYGVPNCAIYASDKACDSCIPPYFLKDNSCLLSIQIDRCANYTANYTCGGCDSGYFLTNTTNCTMATARDCYTYTSINTCERCDPNNSNKGLKTDEQGVTSCVDKNVPSCDVSSDRYPFVCLQCQKGYYVEADGSCNVIITEISKCLVYDSATTCARCEQGSVLSSDKKTCDVSFYTDFNDPNCADSQVMSTPVCSKCKPGYAFNNNTCQLCTTNTYESGCFSCDPNDHKNCLACKSGFYQTANGECIAWLVQNNNDSNQNNGTIYKSASLRMLIRSVLLILLLVIW